ncbi:restriction endonuclease subunit S [Pseudomonas chlororaphis]|uniref:restriction endonuclease subunit S n=1 Tax=Pseudomonas chlororaphis TaxID=587753 RepID=UPI000F585B24|nr:restriction endonuclease subunit S [Pseudomonas chlororaphis]AZC81626.1 Type I restriction-modification system, specificity subunit S [Pseudomonas chlororaphis subsp. piscium]
MSFPAYPEYKPSGFDWLPEVPAHWRDRKIARDIPFVVGWTPPSGKDEYYDGDLPWVTIADMTQISVEDTKSKISHLAVQDKGAKVVPAGSMLFSFKLSVGKIAFLTIDSYTNEAIAGFLPCGPLDLEYWKYAAPEFIPRYGRENIYGATLLNQELISSVRFSAPALAEQTQIARFLDHETARIDALIEEQQRLIEFLKEKRQAVISHAVTKGLDPAVPMKDSGVEWLGDVPEHWAVSPLKYLVEEKVAGPYGASLTKAMYTDSGYRVYGQQQVISDDFSIGDYYIPEEKFSEMQRYVVFPGDVLISVMGTIGRVSVVPPGVEAGIINPRLVRYKFTQSRVNPKFIKILLMSLRYQSRLREESQGSTMEGLNMVILGDLPLILPPLDAQLPIVDFVKDYDTSFNELVSQASSAVDLLQERRSALISAAVTGKIDVRGWQPPANATSPELAQEAV